LKKRGLRDKEEKEKSRLNSFFTVISFRKKGDEYNGFLLLYFPLFIMPI